MKVKITHSCLTLRPHGLYSPWNFPGQNTGVGSLSLLQGIFPTQGSNPSLPLEWLIQLGKVNMTMVIYIIVKNYWLKSTIRKDTYDKVQENSRDGFPFVLSSGVLWALLNSPSIDVWQYILSIVDHGSSPKPWYSDNLVGPWLTLLTACMDDLSLHTLQRLSW